MTKLRTLCVPIILALLCAGAAWSQAVNATLLGSVTDATGAVVQNAKVTLMEDSTGVARTAQTNESGNYTFPDIPPGRYSVTAELSGFKKEMRKSVEVV